MSAISIQLIFLNLDKIRIIFIVFCLRFIDLPKMAHKIANLHNNIFVLLASMSSIIRGRIFCTEIVNQNKFLFLILKHIGINQLWNGAPPSFNIIDIISNNVGLMLVNKKIWFSSSLNRISSELIL